MAKGSNTSTVLLKFLILIGLLLPLSCKTPSILVTEEQRMGDELSNSNDYENAIVHYRNSLAQSRKLGVYRNLEAEADICRKISYSYSVQGKYPEALEYAYYGFSRDSMLQNQLGIIEDCREIGKIHIYMGNFREGIAFLDSVVSMSKGLESSIKSTKLSSLADTHLTLSQVNSVLGKFEPGERNAKAALEIYRQLNNKTGEMECLLQLGKITNETGRLWQAEVYVKLSGKLAGELGLNRSRQLHLQADIAEDKADYQEAIRLRLEAISEAKQSKILPAVIWTTMVCGDTYGLTGDREKAEQYYNEAIALQDSLNIDSRSLAASAELRTGRAKSAASYFSEIGSQVSAGLAYLKLGDLMLERRNYPFALRHYERALTEFKSSGSEEGKAMAYLMLAETFSGMANGDAAYAYIDSSLAITSQPETEWKLSYLLGRVKEKAGRNAEAIEAYRKAIDIIEEIRGRFTIEELKSSYINNKIEVYDRLIRLLMETGDVKEGFNYSERARARAFLDLIGNNRINAHSSENQELAAIEHDLRLQLIALSKVLQQEELGNGRGLNRAALQKELVQKRSMYTDLMQRLKLEAPGYMSVISVHPPDLEKLQSMAGDGHAFIVYWVGEVKSFAWIVKKNEIISREINATEEDLMNLTVDCRNATRRIGDFSGEDIRLESNLSIQTLKDGYRLLVAPLEDELTDLETICIIPHKVLHLLPFQALMTTENFFLIEKHAIYYAPSLGTLFTMQKRPEHGTGSMLAMALGDLALGGFSGLPGTQDEVDEITGIVPGMNALYGKEATETFFKEVSSEYDHIHLATHGYMDQNQPMFSFILLNPTETDDGYLTVTEIFGMTLNAELVVLSACQTGLGELSEGDEVVGLSRAMLYAGSNNVVVSLWSVADEQTAFLMAEFYRNLTQFNAVASLQQAQLATFEKYRSPLFWAPFQLIGKGVTGH